MNSNTFHMKQPGRVMTNAFHCDTAVIIYFYCVYYTYTYTYKFPALTTQHDCLRLFFIFSSLPTSADKPYFKYEKNHLKNKNPKT